MVVFSINLQFHYMNEDIIGQDSLLSNISNISVRIDHNQNDGSGCFKNFARQNQNELEISINALQQGYQSQNHQFFLQKIMLKSKQQLFLDQPDNKWVAGNYAAGLSEEEDQSLIIQNRNIMSEFIEKQPLREFQEVNPIVETQEFKRRKLLLQKRLKNQTKNIPKNYGKAIISFVEKYEDKVKYITKKNGIEYQDFVQELKQKKKAVNTIADLRQMWVDYKYAKCMRLLSNLFLRKYALGYIFNSRICNYGSHIKYRYRLCEAIKEPFSFKHIKDY